MIAKLDNKNEKIVSEIIQLQKASYRIEADLIGFDNLPPLLESEEDIRNSEEIFFGYYEGNKLAGIISYKLDGGTLDIHRLAVHPDFFNRGIARKLLAWIEATPGAANVIVSTGLKNTPAVRLYAKQGFLETGTREVAEGVFIVCFKKEL